MNVTITLTDEQVDKISGDIWEKIPPETLYKAITAGLS